MVLFCEKTTRGTYKINIIYNNLFFDFIVKRNNYFLNIKKMIPHVIIICNIQGYTLNLLIPAFPL